MNADVGAISREVGWMNLYSPGSTFHRLAQASDVSFLRRGNVSIPVLDIGCAVRVRFVISVHLIHSLPDALCRRPLLTTLPEGYCAP